MNYAHVYGHKDSHEIQLGRSGYCTGNVLFTWHLILIDHEQWNGIMRLWLNAWFARCTVFPHIKKPHSNKMCTSEKFLPNKLSIWHVLDSIKYANRNKNFNIKLKQLVQIVDMRIVRSLFEVEKFFYSHNIPLSSFVMWFWTLDLY